MSAIRRPPILFFGEAQRLVHLGRKPLFDFFVGRPCPKCFPRQAWRRLLLQRLASAGSSLSEYQHPAGLLELRHAIAEHLGPARGMNVRAAQVIIVNGIQEALNIIARLFVKPGTPVAIENPCYRGALSMFESYGAEMIPVPVDESQPVFRRANSVILKPGGFFLWQTKEIVGTPEENPRLICFIDGNARKSCAVFFFDPAGDIKDL